MTRHFRTDDDLTSAEQHRVLSRALELKADRFASTALAGPESVAVIFDKPTLRTQVSFATGIAEMGGYPLVLDGRLAGIGRRESVADVARVIGRQVRAIVWRTFAQADLEEMAELAQVPVINALTDQLHPCQGLADLVTVAEHTGGLAADRPALAGRSLAYVGDGSNNMAHTYLLAGAVAGMDIRIGTPPAFQPEARILARAEQIARGTGGSVSVHTDPVAAVRGVDAVATDTWVSMGQEDQADQREAPFRPYQLNADLLAAASSSAIVLHCLPAYRGKEITADVLESEASVVWQEAENRLHVQKAVLEFLVGEA
ncbi:ornithine carbamoyltransferase [Pseudactinotalea sp. Z1732]|uniref:ornithine carbamoyltransferase n=1 Tax=Micrococcales TaxID=85006 RepID=UPI003C7CCA21